MKEEIIFENSTNSAFMPFDTYQKKLVYYDSESRPGNIVLYDFDLKQITHRLNANLNYYRISIVPSVSCAYFLADNRLWAVNLKTGKTKQVWPENDEFAKGITRFSANYNQDLTFVIYNDFAQVIEVLVVQNNGNLINFKSFSAPAHFNSNRLHLSLYGSFLICRHEVGDKRLMIFDIRNGESTFFTLKESRGVCSPAILAQTSTTITLAIGGDFGWIYVIELTLGDKAEYKVILSKRVGKSFIYSVKISDDAKYLICAGYSGVIGVFDIRTWDRVWEKSSKFMDGVIGLALINPAINAVVSNLSNAQVKAIIQTFSFPYPANGDSNNELPSPTPITKPATVKYALYTPKKLSDWNEVYVANPDTAKEDIQRGELQEIEFIFEGSPLGTGSDVFIRDNERRLYLGEKQGKLYLVDQKWLTIAAETPRISCSKMKILVVKNEDNGCWQYIFQRNSGLVNLDKPKPHSKSEIGQACVVTGSKSELYGDTDDCATIYTHAHPHSHYSMLLVASEQADQPFETQWFPHQPDFIDENDTITITCQFGNYSAKPGKKYTGLSLVLYEDRGDKSVVSTIEEHVRKQGNNGNGIVAYYHHDYRRLLSLDEPKINGFEPNTYELEEESDKRKSKQIMRNNEWQDVVHSRTVRIKLEEGTVPEKLNLHISYGDPHAGTKSFPVKKLV